MLVTNAESHEIHGCVDSCCNDLILSEKIHWTMVNVSRSLGEIWGAKYMQYQ